MAVSKRTRFEVLRRDSFTCRYCRSTENPLTVDHVTPRSLGGTDAPGNLVAACIDCNAGKASTSPDEQLVADVTTDAVAWAANLRATLAQHDKHLRYRQAQRDDFLDAWNIWHNNQGENPPLPLDWATTVDQWNNLGATYDTQVEAIRLAMTHRNVAWGDEFRYTAGVVWNIIRESGGA